MANKEGKSPLVATLSGSLAGMVETTFVWPMEYVKTQLQLHKRGSAPQYNSMLSCAKYTYQQNGFLGFYRGLAPVIIGSIPKAGIRFGGFNFFQSKLKKEDGSSSPLRNLAAGTMAGSLEAIIAVTPIETIKTKLIDGNKSFLTGFREIYKAEGLAGIYKGVVPTTCKQGSNQGLRFMYFAVYKDFLLGEDKTAKLTVFQSLIGGMSAGCFSTICNNPFDMVKTRMQGLRATEYKGFFDCLITVVKTEGVTALWAGTLARMSRVVPGQGIIFMSFETISSNLSKILD